MVPVKLQLRNFMCYRGGDNLVDFSGIHLACLTGDNGQGKSALLDAMTWALWGKARTTSADDLITHGESEMEVQLEFELGGARYRAIRKRSTAGRGSSMLELQGRTGNGFFTSLSEGTIRDTQQRINDLLRLDYETFVNSSFLLQGRADEFTTKRPAERKQILADILGLAQYDSYVERARQRAKDAEGRRVQAEGELSRIRAAVAEIPASQEELLHAEGEARRLAQELRAAMERHHALIDQRRALDARAEALTQAERRAQDERGELLRLGGRLGDLRGRREHFKSLLAQAPELEAAIAQLEQARADKERWDELLHQSQSLKNETSEVQQRISQARGELEKELRAIEATIKTHRETLTRNNGRERELGEAQKQVERLEVLQGEREAHQQMLVAQSEETAQLRAQNETLKAAMRDLKERMQLLEGSDEANCPVCHRPLSPEARAEALAEDQREGKRMGDRYRDNQAQMQRVEGEVRTLRETITRAERELGELGRWQRQIGDIARVVKDMREARQKIDEAEQEAVLLRARLEAGDYAHAEQGQLAELANVSHSLGYDQARHDAARQSIQRLAPRQQAYNDMLTARNQQAGLEETLRALEENEGYQKERLASTEEQIKVLSQELQQYQTVVAQVQEQQVVVNTLQRDLPAAERRHGAARQKLADAERHAARQPEVEQAHHAAVEERTIYEQLGNAFGKRGIQAMIIESAIPDIEAEANELLGRMTNGRMSVSVLTQRELKSGDASETLDIVIADENGERPYETFSGGEAFRVNFALRIALSKLLAHRAGTSLRTLVMDEGFGSQDAQGRERLIEAITSVQGDFDRILVITHIDELKDAFPIRIDVVKGANGSRVRVN